ncbi:hypothetical protein F5146DRAFT_1023511 [Armillaria mellea]|nr:hypothetical protein F5146DRAFT_1023511 [Armillaria mellea]
MFECWWRWTSSSYLWFSMTCHLHCGARVRVKSCGRGRWYFNSWSTLWGGNIRIVATDDYLGVTGKAVDYEGINYMEQALGRRRVQKNPVFLLRMHLLETAMISSHRR